MSAEVEDPLSNGHLNRASSNAPLTPVTGAGGDVAEDDEDDEDLFGDEDDEEQDIEIRPSQRKLDDEELDSGDDENRNDRVAATIEDEGDTYQKPTKLVSADIARIKYPAEGEEFYFLNMPPYLGMKHRNYDSATYEPPTLPHDGVDPTTDQVRKFSAFSTATTSLFWRRDPKNSELLQSNSRIVRWSDGSLTLQLASRPTEHYRINTTPVRQKLKPGQSYDPAKDSHMYLAARHATDAIDLQIIRPIDATMKIQPTGEQADESVLRLQESLAAQQSTHDPLAHFKIVEEDPELAKKKAEEFEKDKARTARKREAAEDRLLMRRDRVLGRSGLGGRSTGLSVAGLEDDDGMPSTRTKKRRKVNRRGDIYSDDEDPDAPRGRTREDEYDREDDFLASSDEEPEVYEDIDEEEILAESDDPDRDDLEIEGRQTVIEDRTRGSATQPKSKPKSKGKPKRARMDEIEDEDDDAEAEDDTEYLKGRGGAGGSSPGVAAAGGRRRRVVSDEDDDE